MTAETTRRGFLQGLMGALVISALPKGVAKAIDVDYDPFMIEAPPGWVYQWVRTAVMGEADPTGALEKRLKNGWSFVKPRLYPLAPVSTLRAAIENYGLALMEKPALQVEADERRRRIEGPCARGNHAWFHREDGLGRRCHWCGKDQTEFVDYVPADEPRDDQSVAP